MGKQSDLRYCQKIYGACSLWPKRHKFKRCIKIKKLFRCHFNSSDCKNMIVISVADLIQVKMEMWKCSCYCEANANPFDIGPVQTCDCLNSGGRSLQLSSLSWSPLDWYTAFKSHPQRMFPCYSFFKASWALPSLDFFSNFMVYVGSCDHPCGTSGWLFSLAFQNASSVSLLLGWQHIWPSKWNASFVFHQKPPGCI